MHPASEKRECGFSRTELLASLGALAIVIATILPGLANSNARGDRVRCFNNLRQIGIAFSQFGSEHREQMPWALTMSEGGNFDHPGKVNLHIQMSVLSNYLSSPKVLMDPADGRPDARPSTHWGEGPYGGFLSSGLNSVSYFVGLDGNFTLPTLLAGDHNLRYAGLSSCATGISPVAALFGVFGLAGSAWTNAVHGTSGNVVRYDGGVDEMDTSELFRAINPGETDVSEYHILLPP